MPTPNGSLIERNVQTFPTIRLGLISWTIFLELEKV